MCKEGKEEIGGGKRNKVRKGRCVGRKRRNRGGKRNKVGKEDV
jgi:hypothetical protein